MDERHHELPVTREVVHGIAESLGVSLTPVLGYSQLTLEKMDPADPHRRSLEMILAAGLDMKELVSELLLMTNYPPQH